jgi:hypothetical protein
VRWALGETRLGCPLAPRYKKSNHSLEATGIGKIKLRTHAGPTSPRALCLPSPRWSSAEDRAQPISPVTGAWAVGGEGARLRR